MQLKIIPKKRRPKQDPIEHQLFLKAEINAIDKSKFIESEKAKRDLFFDSQGNPSQDFYIWWISNHGKSFREAWKKSLCQRCERTLQCKDCLREKCEKFLENRDLKFNLFKNIKSIIFKMDKLLSHPIC